MKTIYLIFLLALAAVPDGMGQILMPPLNPAKEGARPPAKEVDRTKTDLWNLHSKLHEHENLEKIERTAAVEVGYAFVSVADHLSIYLHLVAAAKIGEGNGVEFMKFDETLRKAAFEIARAAEYQSGKCDYWIKAVKDETLREQILAGQKAMNGIAVLLSNYFNGTGLDQDKTAPTEQNAAGQPATRPETK
jgi:hypothetical protein